LTFVEQLSHFEYKMRPFLAKLPPMISTAFFSYGRKAFISLLARDLPDIRPNINGKYNTRLWNINFNVPLFNAAGMFKHGEGYYTVARQAAGAYLAGTTTKIPRKGNQYTYIKHPAAVFHNSGMAVNWMGLPNEGHNTVAERIYRLDKIDGCPIGASVSADPSQTGLDALQGVLDGFNVYTKAGVDFLELNESCPNVEHEHSAETINGLDKALVERLEYISQNFIRKRNKLIPVIVKFSNDTAPELVPAIVRMLVELKYDGVNFGNTSTNYSTLKDSINHNEKQLYDFFTKNIGGGISGRALKTTSFALSSLAVQALSYLNPSNEFNIIRTGGIENFDDIELSLKAGIPLNQWFSGYFSSFARYGHNLYSEIFK